MGKLILYLLFLFSLNANAISLDNIFQNDQYLLEKLLLKDSFTFKDFTSLNSIEKLNKILDDPQNKINNKFHITEYFKNNIKFWFNIYTNYDSSKVVIHDKDNLALIYDVLDFSELKSKNFNRFTKEALQSDMVRERIRIVKDEMKYLSKGDWKQNIIKNKIIQSLKTQNIKIPKGKKKKALFFKKLMKNIRAQTGQRENVLGGINNLSIYEKELEKYIKLFKLPRELLAISLLESSFNPKAESKVGARGAWQFMPRVGKYFMTINNNYDERLNPVISSISAFKLLKQNKQILKRWDMSVVAYNSGTKHLIRARKKLKKLKRFISLENIFKNYRHSHLGFASKNFYSEFIALVYTLAYKELLFSKSELNLTKRSLFKNLGIYVTRCNVRPSKLYKLLLKSSPHIDEFNLHFEKKNAIYPAGSLVVSDISLTSKRYYKVPFKSISTKKPKNWKKGVRFYNCSIK